MSSRIQLVLETGLYSEVTKRARSSGASLSLVVRDLLKKALEIEEDVVLAAVADRRYSTLQRKKATSHAAVKKILGHV